MGDPSDWVKRAILKVLNFKFKLGSVSKSSTLVGGMIAALLMSTSHAKVCLEAGVGQETDIRPSWVMAVNAVAPNDSYLQDFYSDPFEVSNDLVEKVLDRKRMIEMRREYEDLIREYEFKRQWDLADVPYADEEQHNAQLAGFSQYVYLNIVSFQVTEAFKKAEKNSEEVRTFRKVQKSVGKVARGEVKVDVSPKFKFGSKTDIPGMKSHFWMNSPYFNSNFDVSFGKPLPYDPVHFKKLGGDRPRETYSVTVYRQIPVVGVDSSVNYGGSTTVMTASLGRNIAPNLRAEVTRRQGFDMERAEMTNHVEEVVKLSYGISF